MRKVGFIGMGNMGYAMLKGLLGTFEKEDIAFTCRTDSKGEKVMAETGVEYVKNNGMLAKNVKYVVLAVKPQMYDDVLKSIKSEISSEQIIISLAPGITMDSVKERLEDDNIRIVRAMPNTPALVGEGMTGVCYFEEEYTEEEINVINSIFESFGKMVKIPERLMSAVVCASGSSPAYVYMFIEALADSVVKYGIPRADAYKLVAQTVLGSAKMVLETGEHPGRLKDNVCSPGGTTIRGVEALEENGMRKALFKATDACYDACNSIK